MLEIHRLSLLFTGGGSCTPLRGKEEFLKNSEDAEFFAALKLNPNPVNYDPMEVAVKSSRVAMQLSASIVFAILYYHISQQQVEPFPVFLLTLITSLIGYVTFYLKYGGASSLFNQVYKIVLFPPREHVKIAVVYLVFSYLLAPTLRTLTDTVSTDTIHVTAFLMLSLHLITNGYGLKGFMVSRPISVNAAVIGSLFLASRLATDWQSIAILTFAVQSFILFPIFTGSLSQSALVLALVICLSAATCYSVSSNVFLGYAILMFFVVVVSPVMFVFSSGFKKSIYGPWDEAIPVITAASTK